MKALRADGQGQHAQAHPLQGHDLDASRQGRRPEQVEAQEDDEGEQQLRELSHCLISR